MCGCVCRERDNLKKKKNRDVCRERKRGNFFKKEMET